MKGGRYKELETNFIKERREKRRVHKPEQSPPNLCVYIWAWKHQVKRHGQPSSCTHVCPLFILTIGRVTPFGIPHELGPYATLCTHLGACVLNDNTTFRLLVRGRPRLHCQYTCESEPGSQQLISYKVCYEAQKSWHLLRWSQGLWYSFCKQSFEVHVCI